MKDAVSSFVNVPSRDVNRQLPTSFVGAQFAHKGQLCHDHQTSRHGGATPVGAMLEVHLGTQHRCCERKKRAVRSALRLNATQCACAVR